MLGQTENREAKRKPIVGINKEAVSVKAHGFFVWRVHAGMG